MKENRKDNVAKFPKGSSVDVEDSDSAVLQDVVRENLKNIIVIGETVAGELVTLYSTKLEDTRVVYMMNHALTHVLGRDYEPLTLELEDDDEGELEEADGEAVEDSPSQDSSSS